MDFGSRRGEFGRQLFDLVRTVQMIRRRRTEERPAVPLGMVGALAHIDQLSGGTSACHAKELAEHSGLDPSTVSRAVAALVAHGLVERRADQADKRASLLAITDAGRAALADAQHWYDDLLAGR